MAELKFMTDANVRSFQQFKDLDKLLVKRDTELRQQQKAHDKSKKKYQDLLAQFTDTLNVKLRYEQIIKNLMENDQSSKKQRKTVIDVIKSTKDTK